MPKSVHFYGGPDGRNVGFRALYKRTRAALKNMTKWTKGNTKWVIQKGLTVAWYMTTITIVTAMPLLFELQREQVVLEMEKLQAKELLAQGYPPSELIKMGMTLEPSVLNAQAGEGRQ